MSSALQQFYSEQNNTFSNMLDNYWAISPAMIAKHKQRIKSLHKRYLSIACLATLIGYRSKRNEYIEGLIETSNLSLILAIKGIENTTYVLLRQTIELTFKHIFFATHPTEYSWVQYREDYKEPTFHKLIEYMHQLDEVKKFDEGGKIIDKIYDKYAVLSRYVHVHNKGFIGYKKAYSTYFPNNNLLKKYEDYTKLIWPLLTILLIINFPDKYIKSNEIEKKVIKKPVSKELISKLNLYLSL